jgi:hypothetical protein
MREYAHIRVFFIFFLRFKPYSLSYKASSLQVVCVHCVEDRDKCIMGSLCPSVCVCLSVQLHTLSQTLPRVLFNEI